MPAQLSITVDVDGVAGLPGGGAGFEHRLSRCSERTYGLGAGLARVLAVLSEFDVPATFYVPGATAERHSDEISGLVTAGHEIGHHGHTHRFPNTLPDTEQRAEIEAGTAALCAIAGRQPAGYRAPGWELTRATLDVLGASGFAWDSSLMGDDRPYLVESAGRRMVELPVHWALDDAPHFAHTTDPAGLLAVWVRELEVARSEHRHVTVTCHPEILGRGHRVDVLRRLLDSAVGQVPCLTHGRVVAALAP
jgi:peptidoglycan/xylan/chitin deacetylase (PgdA/CDA1 family)